ncbi:MAG: hypothetical protein MRZ62_05105 [Brachyspira sp.]|nr:hypothetical protein [Brachyspira sp.]
MNIFLTLISIPLLFIFDLPSILMPFALVALVGLAGYSVISRNFQKFSKLSAILFMLLICGIVFVNVETLFRVSDYFNRNDYINLAVNYLIFCVSIAITMATIKRQDTRYTSIATLLLVLGYICQLYFYAG